MKTLRTPPNTFRFLLLVVISFLASYAPWEVHALIFFHKSSEVPENETKVNYEGRDLYVHVPRQLPAAGTRALVVVLHGGMGNAERIISASSEKGMNLDEMSDKYGFLVAYLNGTPVTRFLGGDKKGWNAGECCGQSADKNIDDVGYITGAVEYLEKTYGVSSARVYGIGHSNGAMMTQRILCETTLYAAGISISGGLELATQTCPGARGRKLLELHGKNDENVPIEGGTGKGISNKYPKRSQAYSQQLFMSSGGEYILQVLPDAAHQLDTIEAALEKQEGVSLPQRAVRFFGLDH